MGFKCASMVRVAFAVFSSFPTCCIIASEHACGIVLGVVRVLRVAIFCFQRCLWTHVLRYPRFVRSVQL